MGGSKHCTGAVFSHFLREIKFLVQVRVLEGSGGAFWGAFGRLLGTLWGTLGPLWDTLGPLWDPFGTPWVPFGPFFAHLRVTMAPLWRPWGAVGCLWRSIWWAFGTF